MSPLGDASIACRAAGYRTVGQVERETYAAATLVARMEEAALDCAPVWDDVGTFDGRPWRGAVDIVTAGYPCQPISVAGTFETVNTLGLPLYARTIPDRDRDEWVRLEIESNPLPICTRPQVLRSARRT
jgi:site-specific DNA-cytosine methylase